MYPALQSASLTVAAFVRHRLETDPVLSAFFDPASGGTLIVSINNPQEMSDAHQEGVSLWMYRLIRDADRLNQPNTRLNGRESRFPSLPLRLHYLVTPFVRAGSPNSAELEQRILGKVMQTFHDHPRFRGGDLEGDLSGSGQEFQVSLESLPLEDIARVWNALNQPYQLSVSYEAAVVNIDSELIESVAPVQSAEPVSAVIVGGGAP
ncbi:MAG TPA: DUF4255 domain-containing protein [Bryobacteraceae bacterium]|jgi:hypothetical protein